MYFMMKKLAAIIILLVNFSLPNAAFSESAPEMRVHFIDVGQGDSILIQTPLDEVILIDGGPPEAGKAVVDYLDKLSIDAIDLLIATHPDIDHIGGLPKVMESVRVKQILDTGIFHMTKAYASYMSQVRKQNIPIRIAEKNERLEIDPTISVEVLNAHNGMKSNNKSSIVLQVSYGEIDFLLMSDVEKEQEREFLKEYDVQAEIIKVGHHGSETSSSLQFLLAVNPEVAILTYSKENNYGHLVKSHQEPE